MVLHSFVARQLRMFLDMAASGTSRPRSLTRLEHLVAPLTPLSLGTCKPF